MTGRLFVFALLAFASTTAALEAQGVHQVVAAARYESYSFDPGGVGFRDVSELTIPVGLNASVGNRITVALSTGYARIDVTLIDGTETSVSGVLDTEIRIGYSIVPGRLVFVATGVIPTGVETVELSQVSALGALASDVIGFAAPALGTGGAIGGGLVGGVPIGRWALGFGATYKYALSYVPLSVQPDAELRIGPELRVRGGLEGPLGRHTYLRMAGVFATRGKDEFAEQTTGGVGDRIIGYVALNQGIGNSQLTVYAFDVYRNGPRLEPGFAGSLPKGNLFTTGLRFDVGLGSTTLSPRAEFRVSEAAPRVSGTTASTSAKSIRAGSAVRIGVDLKQVLSPRLTLLLQADGVKGDVRDVVGGFTDFSDFDGFRFGFFLTVSP